MLGVRIQSDCGGRPYKCLDCSHGWRESARLRPGGGTTRPKMLDRERNSEAAYPSMLALVKEVAFDGSGNPGFAVELKGGGESFILAAQIIALGDVLLVRSKYQCPKCGHLNKESSRFCVKCGSGL